MTVYEIVNPSDAYTMETDDFLAAAIAVTHLGDGWYALMTEGGETAFGMALMGDEAFRHHFGKTTSEAIESVDPLHVALALESVTIGGFAERREVEEAVKHMTAEHAATYRRERAERVRSSLNDIGHRAELLAHAWRTIAKKKAAQNG